MFVAEIWRYPVKSMVGERLLGTPVGLGGIPGDRVVHAENGNRQVLTARRHPALLGCRATLDPGGEPLVDGRPWASDEVARRVGAAVGQDVRLVRFDGLERFDVLPLLFATDGAITRLGADRRRLRPNVMIGGVPAEAERAWPGRRLRMGTVLVEAVSLRQRCVMTTYDPDTQVQDVSVLRRIVRDFGGRLALDCRVLEPGAIAVGDPVEVLADRAPTTREEDAMSKFVKCGDIVPGCEFVAEGQDDAEVLSRVADHAKADHGEASVSPELVAKVQAAIRPR